MPSLRSLFVVALPRSLSTLVHTQAALALGLATPRWTNAGEILNGDRAVISASELAAGHPKFTPPEEGYVLEQLAAFLDDVVRPTGHAYKDVVQPFAVAAWLRERQLCVLRIARPLADVAFSMHRAGWLYPQVAGPATGAELDRFLLGLRRADLALAAIPARVLEAEELLREPEALERALSALYPEIAVPPIALFDEGFRLRREQLARDRETPAYRLLADRLEELGA